MAPGTLKEVQSRKTTTHIWVASGIKVPEPPKIYDPSLAENSASRQKLSRGQHRIKYMYPAALHTLAMCHDRYIYTAAEWGYGPGSEVCSGNR